VLMGNGPDGGSPDDVKPMQTIIAGIDPVAIDTWACDLVGLAPEAQPRFLTTTEALGLGQRDYRALNPIEITSG
jgi:hypothetical protein